MNSIFCKICKRSFVRVEYKLPEVCVDCLMYADDIVMFFSSPQGLQQKLNSLEKYCDDWGMQANSSKTKVIIFYKAGRTIEHNFQ